MRQFQWLNTAVVDSLMQQVKLLQQEESCVSYKSFFCIC